MSQANCLRLILGDQLNPQHSWYQQRDDGVIYVIAELRQETDYTRHHVQKVCAFFAAMQAFAAALKKAGHRVLHLTLDDTADDTDLVALLQRLCGNLAVTQLEYQRPDEYRLRQQLSAMRLDGVSVTEVDSEHFLLPFADIQQQFSPGKHRKMEFFYRDMRRRFQVLMDDDQPRGGKWNFDADNRNRLGPADIDALPQPLCFSNPVNAILERLQRHGVDTFGHAAQDLLWPVTPAQAEQLLAFFCDTLLPLFGRFQDAMTGNSPHAWSLYHSRLSFALNSKLLHPMQVIDAALRAFENQPDAIDIAQIEGFVRQILGWREYIRGVYWANMPDYKKRNALGAKRPLPRWFWDGDTHMRCQQQAIRQSLDFAYAHHIQRLMVTGNFCLLAGIDPDQVDQWYLGIYVDALEWVELPNTRGMSQFADGGIVATKAYSASGNYLNKMSDYCGDCHYNVKQKTGPKACPLNSLYWDFMLRHRAQFERNPRVGMVYRNWDRMADDKQRAVIDYAGGLLAKLDEL